MADTPAIYREQLPGGVQLLAEPIPGAQSLSMSMLLPAGVAAEPEDRQGVATLLAEMICRGAGGLSAREHSDALDRLGVQRGTSVQTDHLRVGATMIGDKLPEALPLLLDMVRRPALEAASLEPSRDLAIQAIDGLVDAPQQRVMLELRRRHFPDPSGRSPLGRREHLAAITADQVRDYWRSRFVPGGTILSFAGKLDWPSLRDRVAEALADWSGEPAETIPETPGERGYEHMEAQTAQVHIAVAYDAVPESDERSVLQKAAAAVLSGGMSGRLFTEVREKRGLCYAVSAGYAGQKVRGAMLSYAGTTTPRAQETLDVLTQELRRVNDGVEQAEFDRALVGMKSRLVMQGESTAARAGAIAMDQHILGRPRSLDELAAEVDSVTLGALNAFLAEHRPEAMTIVTVGPAALSVDQPAARA